MTDPGRARCARADACHPRRRLVSAQRRAVISIGNRRSLDRVAKTTRGKPAHRDQLMLVGRVTRVSVAAEAEQPVWGEDTREIFFQDCRVPARTYSGARPGLQMPGEDQAGPPRSRVSPPRVCRRRSRHDSRKQEAFGQPIAAFQKHAVTLEELYQVESAAFVAAARRPCRGGRGVEASWQSGGRRPA